MPHYRNDSPNWLQLPLNAFPSVTRCSRRASGCLAGGMGLRVPQEGRPVFQRSFLLLGWEGSRALSLPADVRRMLLGENPRVPCRLQGRVGEGGGPQGLVLPNTHVGTYLCGARGLPGEHNLLAAVARADAGENQPLQLLGESWTWLAVAALGHLMPRVGVTLLLDMPPHPLSPPPWFSVSLPV